MKAGAVVALLAVALTADVPAPARTRLVVVVPPSQTLTDLSVADLRRIYLGDITRWPDGHRIVPVMLSPPTREGDLFLKRVVLMSTIDFAQHWIGAVFRGRAPAPPIIFNTAADALRFVSTHPDAMAVVGDDVEIASGLHVMTIDHKMPEAADYPLSW